MRHPLSSILQRLAATALFTLCFSFNAWAAQSGYTVETVADNLDRPWSIAFLPGGDRLVAELTGTLRRITPDNVVGPAIEGVPSVYRAGQGGLFDVLPDPDFANNATLYLSYAAGDRANNATTVARATLDGDTLRNVTEIYAVTPTKYAPMHYGGRLAWLPDGTLLLSTGDGFDFREQAQALESELGKTIRMNADGSAPADNPFPDAPMVWTYGHRNPQGLTVTADGTVYQHEHGPRGGDEVNILQAGRNYGWPAITYGMDYNGALCVPFHRDGGHGATPAYVGPVHRPVRPDGVPGQHVPPLAR